MALLRAAVIGLGAFLVVLLAGPVPAADAHGPGIGIQLALSEHEGATTVRCFLLYQSDHEPVNDALVVGRLEGPGPVRQFWAKAERRTPGLFVATLRLPAGSWRMLVQSSGSNTSARFRVTPDGSLRDVSVDSPYAGVPPPATAGGPGGGLSAVLLWSVAGVLLLGAVATAVILLREQQERPPDPIHAGDVTWADP